MIVNDSETKILSALGSVDKASFCVVDTKDNSISNFSLEDANYVTIQKMKNDCFLCLHHFKGEKLVLTAHSFKKPDSVIGRIQIQGRMVDFSGDVDIWENATRFFVEWIKDDYYLLELNPHDKKATFHPIGWFHAEEYDRGYQGLYQVLEIPNTDLLLFSIQRSSSPVLYDLKKKQVTGKIKLASRCGNPLFQFRNNQAELWTVDYDTLVSLEVGSWDILQAMRFQKEIDGNTMAFVGEFSFSSNEEYCALARPYSNDVLLLESENMKEVGKIESNFQPLQVALLSNLKCVYRDWKTGKFDFQSFAI